MKYVDLMAMGIIMLKAGKKELTTLPHMPVAQNRFTLILGIIYGALPLPLYYDDPDRPIFLLEH